MLFGYTAVGYARWETSSPINDNTYYEYATNRFEKTAESEKNFFIFYFSHANDYNEWRQTDSHYTIYFSLPTLWPFSQSYFLSLKGNLNVVFSA